MDIESLKQHIWQKRGAKYYTVGLGGHIKFCATTQAVDDKAIDLMRQMCIRTAERILIAPNEQLINCLGLNDDESLTKYEILVSQAKRDLCGIINQP